MNRVYGPTTKPSTPKFIELQKTEALRTEAAQPHGRRVTVDGNHGTPPPLPHRNDDEDRKEPKAPYDSGAYGTCRKPETVAPGRVEARSLEALIRPDCVGPPFPQKEKERARRQEPDRFSR